MQQSKYPKAEFLRQWLVSHFPVINYTRRCQCLLPLLCVLAGGGVMVGAAQNLQLGFWKLFNGKLPLP